MTDKDNTQAYVNRMVLLNIDDVQLALARGLKISTTCREAFHFYIAGTSDSERSIEFAQQEYEATKKQAIEINALLLAKEKTLKELKRVALLDKERREEEERMKIEEKEKKDKTCVMCNCDLTEARQKQRINYGEHAGRYVCGGLTSGCFEQARTTNKDWF